jgi:hypothetical protein
MTRPTAADSHVAQVLTDWAISYANSADSFKADKLSPNVPSSKREARFYTYDKAPWFTDEMSKRGEGAPVPLSGYTLSNTLFDIDTWSLGKAIDDQTRDNEDDILDSDQDAAEFLMNKERIRREKAFAAACLATSKWSTDVTGNTSASSYGADTVAQWDDSDSAPLIDIATYRTRMKLATGLDPNVLVIGRQVWDILKNHDDILANMTGGSNSSMPAKATLSNVAALFELEEIVVMDAVENTADAPAAMTGAFIAGKHGLLMHRNMNAGRKGATAVKTMAWQRPGTDQRGFRMLKSAIDIHRDLVEVESNFSIKICAADLGIFFNGLVG